MLIKHDSPVAQKAAFPTPRLTPNDDVVSAQPSEQEIALAELEYENEALRSEIARLRANWADELALAEQRAREAAARDHVRDDAMRVEILGRALTDARRQFETSLATLAGRAATELALAAMDKLFQTRADEADLLARVISRRLADFDEKAIVELQLSPGDAEGAVGAEVTAMLPQGTQVVTDPALSAGTARVQLRLGGALIDPAAGFERLCALLAEGGENA